MNKRPYNWDDKTGRVFGLLTVLRFDEEQSGPKSHWLCLCECGEVVSRLNASLHPKSSCGRCTNRKDMTGQKIGMLTVITYRFTQNKEPYWLCECDCGSQVVKGSRYLRDKRKPNKSCGCLPLTGKKSFKGITNIPEYKKLAGVYRGIINRCYDPDAISYPNYGERGIRVCAEWLNDPISFVQFALNNGWKPGLHTDRIDVNGDYSPENCRFISQKENSRNTRTNHLVEYRGRLIPVSQAVEEAGNVIQYKTAITRINKLGWDVARAVETPSGRKNG